MKVDFCGGRLDHALGLSFVTEIMSGLRIIHDFCAYKMFTDKPSPRFLGMSLSAAHIISKRRVPYSVNYVKLLSAFGTLILRFVFLLEQTVIIP